jgi:hypothetical protein
MAIALLLGGIYHAGRMAVSEAEEIEISEHVIPETCLAEANILAIREGHWSRLTV